MFIDGCAVNRFAGLNLNPIKALENTEFAVAVTPDLATEYARALAHRAVEPHIKALLARLLEQGMAPAATPIPPDPRGTDWTLMALAQKDLVITHDRKGPWREAKAPGLVFWAQIEPAIRSGATLAEILRLAARRIDA